MKNVSCEYDRLNGWNSTLQASWYIRHVRWVYSFYSSFRIWCLWTKATIWLLDRFLWGLILRLRSFLCLQVSYCPAKRGNRAGSSRNEFDYSGRGTQAIFPPLDCRSCDNFGLAHFSIFLLEKKSWSNRAPILINCQFSDYTIEKCPSPKFSQLRLSRSEKLIWVPIRE